MKPTKAYTDVLSLIIDEVKDVDRSLARLENDTVPTFPRATTLPPVGVVGQIIVADDDLLYSFNGTSWQLAF